MGADDQDVSPWGRAAWLVLLIAWIVVAISSFVVLGAARSDLWKELDQLPASHLRGVLRGWVVSLKLCQGLLVVLILLAVWAAVLLLRRQPHPRQWATILVFSVLTTLGWLLFAGLGAPLAEARGFIAPEPAYVAQLLVFAGAALVFVTAVVRVRRAPEPVEPQQDRYHIASYTQFNKPSATSSGDSALAEARSRAESVLPLDAEED